MSQTLGKRDRDEQTIIEEEEESPLKKQALESIDDSSQIIQLSTMQTLLECSVCFEMLYNPYTLTSCSHTFCYTCIHKWLATSKTCPLCRQRATRRPFRNEGLQKVVQCCEDVMNPVEKGKREDHKASVNASEDEATDFFNKTVEDVRVQGSRFLNVVNSWSLTEKLHFKQNLDQYYGERRIMFMTLTGFTKELIETCSDEILEIVCSNVGIRIITKVDTSGISTPDYRTTRAVLAENFII